MASESIRSASSIRGDSVGDALERISDILEELVNSVKRLEERISVLEDRQVAGEGPCDV